MSNSRHGELTEGERRAIERYFRGLTSTPAIEAACETLQLFPVNVAAGIERLRRRKLHVVEMLDPTYYATFAPTGPAGLLTACGHVIDASVELQKELNLLIGKFGKVAV
jgi:predicted Zn-dependent protease